jgi:hypothetical protein
MNGRRAVGGANAPPTALPVVAQIPEREGSMGRRGASPVCDDSYPPSGRLKSRTVLSRAVLSRTVLSRTVLSRTVLTKSSA